MGVKRGWVPAFALVMAALSGRGDAKEWTEDGVMNGCRVEPNVRQAVYMECDFSGIRNRFRTTFRAGNLPSSIQTVRISNALGLIFANDTFSSLTSLQSIYLNNISVLQIDKTNWTQIAQPEHVTITIDRVLLLTLGGGAFSGWQSPGPKIVIGNVSSCKIEESAFDSDSVIQSVVLQGIEQMTLDDLAFRADIGQLQLRDTSLNRECRSNTFGGRIANLSLSSVKLKEVHSGCMQAGDGWGSLTIRSSHFGDIQPFGINGSINDVLIEDSRLGSVHQHGLHVRASTFTMKSTVVEELSSDALDVQFTQSATLQTSTIPSLRANAFRRLMTHAGVATLTFRRVSVIVAEDGSLAFSEQTQPTVLDVVLHYLCDCDLNRRALRLVMAGGGAPHRDGTDKQRRAAQQAVNQLRCKSGTDTPTLAEFRCQSCSSQDGGTAQCPPLVWSAVVDVWVWPVGGVTLLLLTVGAVVMLVKRRRSQHVYHSGRKEEHPLTSSCHSDHQKQNVAPEPHYCGFRENFKSDERRACADAAPSPPDHPPEAEYCDVGLTGPRVPSSEYAEMFFLSADSPQQPVYANCVAADQQQL